MGIGLPKILRNGNRCQIGGGGGGGIKRGMGNFEREKSALLKKKKVKQT